MTISKADENRSRMSVRRKEVKQKQIDFAASFQLLIIKKGIAILLQGIRIVFQCIRPTPIQEIVQWQCISLALLGIQDVGLIQRGPHDKTIVNRAFPHHTEDPLSFCQSPQLPKYAAQREQRPIRIMTRQLTGKRILIRGNGVPEPSHVRIQVTDPPVCPECIGILRV